MINTVIHNWIEFQPFRFLSTYHLFIVIGIQRCPKIVQYIKMQSDQSISKEHILL